MAETGFALAKATRAAGIPDAVCSRAGNAGQRKTGPVPKGWGGGRPSVALALLDNTQRYCLRRTALRLAVRRSHPCKGIPGTQH